MRAVHASDVVCEPRHPTWFDDDADVLLSRYHVARVAADPACVPAAARPGGASHLVYVRLHGSPQMYRSPYTASFLEHTAELLIGAQPRANGGAGDVHAVAATVWCIFDNTALGAATGDALALLRLLDHCRR